MHKIAWSFLLRRKFGKVCEKKVLLNFETCRRHFRDQHEIVSWNSGNFPVLSQERKCRETLRINCMLEEGTFSFLCKDLSSNKYIFQKERVFFSPIPTRWSRNNTLQKKFCFIFLKVLGLLDLVVIFMIPQKRLLHLFH